jgi:hypothetical protein
LSGKVQKVPGRRKIILKKVFKEPLRIQVIHHHAVLHCPIPVFFYKEETIFLFQNRTNPDVHLGRKPAVELNLSFAKVTALLQGCKVEKSVIFRLFDLIYPGRGDENCGDMGVNNLHPFGAVRIETRIRHPLEDDLLR